MTVQDHSPIFGTDDTTPAKRQWYKKPLFLLPVGALLLGLAIGSANTPDPVTVTVEKPVEKIVTKTVTETVEKTPASCLRALEVNELAFTLFSSALKNILAGDLATANTTIEQVGAMVPENNAAKAECRAK